MGAQRTPSAAKGDDFLEVMMALVAERIADTELPSGYSLESFKNETDDEIFDLTDRVEKLETVVAEQAALIKRLTRRVGNLEWGNG